MKSSFVALVVVLAVMFNPILQPLATTASSNIVTPIAVQGAADATPEADEAVCTTSPRPFADLAAMADEPAGGLRSAQLGTPSAEIATLVPPTGGSPPDPAVVEAVTAAVHELYACMNSGDLLRSSALWTDDFLGYGMGGLDVEIIARLATPAPLPAADRVTIVAVEDVRVLEDGRVTALVRSEEEQAIHVFVVADGRYLLDGVFEIANYGTPAP